MRAQTLRPDRDFSIINGSSAIMLCKTPSPAAAASLEIGRLVAEHIPEIQMGTSVWTP